MKRVCAILGMIACMISLAFGATVLIDHAAAGFSIAFTLILVLVPMTAIWVMRTVVDWFLGNYVNRAIATTAVGASLGSVVAVGAFIAAAMELSIFAAVIAVAFMSLPVFMALPAVLGLSQLLPTWFRKNPIERIVITHVSVAVRANLPLATTINLAADAERGWARINLRRVAHLLGQGATVTDAVRQGCPQCSGLVVSLIAAGERTGQLAAALELAEEQLVATARRRERFDLPIWGYVVCIGLTTVVVVSGIMVAVIPKYKEIFKDFSAELPAPTRLLMDVAHSVTDTAATPFVLIALSILAPFCLYLSFRPRRVPNPSWVSCAVDWVRWRLPGFYRQQYAAGLSQMLWTMSLAARSGADLTEAGRIAGDIDVNVYLRRRMKRFCEQLTAGKGIQTAARDMKLGNVAGLAMATGARSGDMASALKYAAEYYDAILSRFLAVLQSLAWPLATLVMSSIVACVVLALFYPLVALINSVVG